MSKPSPRKPVHTSWKQKIALILFGLFLALVFLEVGLRAGGEILTWRREKSNLHSLQEKGHYVILCLGESTTYVGNYPQRLELLLNRETKNNFFSVINKGVPGTNTSVILANLSSIIERYHPNMVVLMMGINDSPSITDSYPITSSSSKPILNFVRNLRILKLFHLLAGKLYSTDRPGKLGIGSSLNPISIPDLSDDNGPPLAASDFGSLEESLRQPGISTQSLAQLIKGLDDPKYVSNKYLEYLEMSGRLEDANTFGVVALGLFPGNLGLLQKMCWTSYQAGNYDQTADYCLQALKKYPDDVFSLGRLGAALMLKGETQAGINYLKLSISQQFESGAVQIGEANFAYEFLFAHYLRNNQWEELEKLTHKLLDQFPQNQRIIKAWATVLLRQDPRAAEKFISEHEVTPTMSRSTVTNYRRIVAQLVRNEIKVVCVQYPNRPLEPLQLILEEFPGLIFVDNSKSFSEEIKKYGPGKVFSDLFAGDFGHLTNYGATLLASNISIPILKFFGYQEGLNQQQFKITAKISRQNDLLLRPNTTLAVSSQHLVHQGADQLTDDDENTYWHVSLAQAGEPAWVSVDLGEGNDKAVNQLGVKPRRDIPAQSFRNAFLQTSTNGTDWIDLADVSQPVCPLHSGWLTWSFNNSQPYRYYRLLITEGHEGGEAHHFYSMAELAFFE